MRDGRVPTPIERQSSLLEKCVRRCSRECCRFAFGTVDTYRGERKTEGSFCSCFLLFFFFVRVPLSFHSLLSPCRRFLFATLFLLLSLSIPFTTTLVFVVACSAIGDDDDDDDDDDNIATRFLAPLLNALLIYFPFHSSVLLFTVSINSDSRSAAASRKSSSDDLPRAVRIVS